MGAFVEVKDEFQEWKDLLNVAFGKNLDSFLVHDNHDRMKLEAIFRKFRVNKNIVTRKFEKFDYSHGKVNPKYVAIIDTVNIIDENVLYTLIDSNMIEKNILVNDRNTGNQILRQQSGNHQNKVMNVFVLLDHKSGQKLSGDATTFRIDPVFYRNREPHKFNNGGSDPLQTIKQLEKEINAESTQNNDLVREKRRLKMIQQNELQDLEKNRERVDKKIRKLNDEIFKIENKLTENGDLSIIESIKEKIEEHEQQIRLKKGVIHSLEEEREGEIANFKEKNSLFQLEKKVLASLERISEKWRKKLADLETEFHVKETEKAQYEQQKSKKESTVASLKEKISRGEVALEQHTQEALGKCTREDIEILPSDTVESITEEYKRAQEAVRETEKTIGRTYEEIQEELLTNKEKKESLEATEVQLETISRSLREDLNQRLNYLQITIVKSMREASNSFERSLAYRGFRGELRFAFKEKTLTMLVQTNDASEGDASSSTDNINKKRTVDSLSGGEKSFTQIALLLAIWKAMNSKIRGLDEFDVFMDSVNRSISIRLLLTELRKYPKSQSIFITPQDIAIVGDLDSDDIKIHRMDDPRNR